jgi:hypothetical protein
MTLLDDTECSVLFLLKSQATLKQALIVPQLPKCLLLKGEASKHWTCTALEALSGHAQKELSHCKPAMENLGSHLSCLDNGLMDSFGAFRATGAPQHGVSS